MTDRMEKIIAAGEADAEAYRAEERAAVLAWLRDRAHRMRFGPEQNPEGAHAVGLMAVAIEFKDPLKEAP